MNKALELYTQNPKFYNCAQAVVAASDMEALVPSMKTCGGGHADGGRCGALYAILTLLPKVHHEEAIRLFVLATKSEICLELKTMHGTSCSFCVKTAFDIFQTLQAIKK